MNNCQVRAPTPGGAQKHPRRKPPCPPPGGNVVPSSPLARGAGGRLGPFYSLLARLAARGPLPARPLLPRLLSTNLGQRAQIEFLFSFYSMAALRSSTFFPMTVLPEKAFASTTSVSPPCLLPERGQLSSVSGRAPHILRHVISNGVVWH